MKKIIFIAVLLLPVKAFSQPGQGDFIISGKFSFNGNKQERFNNGSLLYHDTRNNFTIAADALYFFTDRFGAGIFDRQQFLERINDNEEVYHDNLNTLGLTGRVYLTGGKGGVLLSGYAGLHFGRTEGPGERDIMSGFYTAVSPVAYYYITDNIAIEAQFGVFGYDRIKTRADGTNVYIIDSGVVARFNLADISLGMSFKF